MVDVEEPAQVHVQLHALHFEWNAPVLATLKRVLGTESALATGGFDASESDADAPAT